MCSPHGLQHRAGGDERVICFHQRLGVGPAPSLRRAERRRRESCTAARAGTPARRRLARRSLTVRRKHRQHHVGPPHRLRSVGRSAWNWWTEAPFFSESDGTNVNPQFNRSTEGLVCERQFRMMRACASIVNTARGPIMDHSAVAHALKDDWIAGAGIDVIPVEPTPKTAEIMLVTTGARPATTGSRYRGRIRPRAQAARCCIPRRMMPTAESTSRSKLARSPSQSRRATPSSVMP